MTVSNIEFDGFYFQPVGDSEVEFSYFLFNDEKDRGIKVDKTSMGDIYHIVLWSFDRKDIPQIKDNYEAILVDPVYYAKQATECNIPSYGVILKKTSESYKFVESYIEKFENSIKTAIKIVEELNKTKQKKGWFRKWMN